MADNYSNLYNQYGNAVVSPYMAQQMQSRAPLPQPIGSAYNLTTASEIYNIPAGNNTSVGICLNEQVAYLKSYQNGYPVIVGYRLTPLEVANQPNAQAAASETNLQQDLNINIKELMKKLDNLELPKPTQKEAIQWQV